MAGYAPGVGAYEDEGQRRANHQMTRNVNIRDLFMGLGMIGQQLGAARRMREAEADQQAESQMLGRVYQEDAAGGPQPAASNPAYGQMSYGIGSGQAGNNMVEMPAEARMAPGAQEQILAGGGGPASALTNLANSFTFGTRAGRLSPQAQQRLLETQRGLRNDRATMARGSREDARRDEELALKRAEIDVKREEAAGKFGRTSYEDDVKNVESGAKIHIAAMNKAGTLRDLAMRARSGRLTTEDFIGNEVLKQAAESNPTYKTALDEANEAGITPKQRVERMNKLGDLIDAAAEQQLSFAEATKAPAEAYRRIMEESANRLYPGGVGNGGQAAPSDEAAFEQAWLRKNNKTPDTLTEDDLRRMAIEYDQMKGGG